MRNCLIFTSGLKSYVTKVFLDPDFLYNAEIPAIRKHRQKFAYFMFIWIFRTFSNWPNMAVCGAK